MAKRPRHSRWRRLPGVYRFHEEKGLNPNLEPQRLTLYLTGTQLDAAEALASQEGGVTLQEYCTALLQDAIEAERIKAHVADIEAHRGLFEGLHQIADDPEYLAEWSAQVAAQARDRPEPARAVPADDPSPVPDIVIDRDAAPLPEHLPFTLPDPGLEPEIEAEPSPDATPASPSPGRPVMAVESTVPGGSLSTSAQVVLRHAGQAGDDGPSFLANLRRGESVPLAEVAELARALHVLEEESRDASVMDRRVVYALHRLAFESQVLHTDAWPGAFDDWTVDTLRAVQEAVDRVLSGQDIRYYSPGSRPEIPR